MSEDVVALAAAAAQVLTAAMETDRWERTRDGLAAAVGVDLTALEESRTRVLDVDAADRADRLRQETADWRYELIGHLAVDARRARAVDRWMWAITHDETDGEPAAVPAPRRPLLGRLRRRR